jgi:hypothetical protein
VPVSPRSLELLFLLLRYVRKGCADLSRATRGVGRGRVIIRLLGARGTLLVTRGTIVITGAAIFVVGRAITGDLRCIWRPRIMDGRSLDDGGR